MGKSLCWEKWSSNCKAGNYQGRCLLSGGRRSLLQCQYLHLVWAVREWLPCEKQTGMDPASRKYLQDQTWIQEPCPVNPVWNSKPVNLQRCILQKLPRWFPSGSLHRPRRAEWENKWRGNLGGWDHLLPLPPVLPQKRGPIFIPDMLGFCVRSPLRKSSLMKINEQIITVS